MLSYFEQEVQLDAEEEYGQWPVEGRTINHTTWSLSRESNTWKRAVAVPQPRASLLLFFSCELKQRLHIPDVGFLPVPSSCSVWRIMVYLFNVISLHPRAWVAWTSGKSDNVWSFHIWSATSLSLNADRYWFRHQQFTLCDIAKPGGTHIAPVDMRKFSLHSCTTVTCWVKLHSKVWTHKSTI